MENKPSQNLSEKKLKKMKRDRDTFQSGIYPKDRVDLGTIQPDDDSQTGSEDEKDAMVVEQSTATTSSDRIFCKKWLSIFPWLLHRDEKMFCQWCLNFHKKGSFVRGSKRFKIDGLRNHASSKKHLESISLKRMAANAQTMLQQTFILAQREFDRYFKLVKFVTKENLAIIKYQQLIKLAKTLGIVFPWDIYQSSYAFREMLIIMSDVCLKNLITLVKESPWFAILVDESTDIEVDKSLIINIKFFNSKTFTVDTSFLKITNIDKADSLSIYTVISDLLKNLGLSTSYMLAWGSDGAK